MKAKEALLKNFFQNVAVAIRGVNISSQLIRWQVCYFGYILPKINLEQALKTYLFQNTLSETLFFATL